MQRVKLTAEAFDMVVLPLERDYHAQTVFAIAPFYCLWCTDRIRKDILALEAKLEALSVGPQSKQAKISASDTQLKAEASGVIWSYVVKPLWGQHLLYALCFNVPCLRTTILHSAIACKSKRSFSDSRASGGIQKRYQVGKGGGLEKGGGWHTFPWCRYLTANIPNIAPDLLTV